MQRTIAPALAAPLLLASALLPLGSSPPPTPPAPQGSEAVEDAACAACGAALEATEAAWCAACAEDPALWREPSEDLPAAWRALVGGVDEARLQAAVHSLVACGPRMGGTRSGEAASSWLLDAFGATGLDAWLRLDPETWCHEESAWSVSASAGEGEAARSVTLERAWPYGYSPSSAGATRLSLEAGEGVARLVERLPRGFGRRGEAPEAVVLVDGSVTAEGDYPKVQHLRSGDANPAPVFGIGAEEGALLRGWLAEGLEVTLHWSLEAEVRRARPRTTIARLAAREGAPPGYLLYCAHGDSDAGGPGADDNASGAAVVLEIARAWAAAVADGSVPAPPREVRFAVWGSEIHSTRDYLRQLTPERDGPLLGVINYDQAGYGSGADQLNIEPDDLPANRVLIQAILGVLEAFDGTGGLPARWATNKSLGGTDSYVFSSSELFRENQRPSLTLFTSAWDHFDEQPVTEGMPGEAWNDRDKVLVDYDVYYHSAGDTPENTTDKEPWNMGWCARVGLIGGLVWLEGLEATTAPVPSTLPAPSGAGGD